MTERKTPPPPKTRSGEMTAVKIFRKEIDEFDSDTVPKMDVEVDRMNELLKQVTITPDTVKQETPIPRAPRSPSFTDEEERAPDTTPTGAKP